MRRASLAFLAFLLLTTTCAGGQPSLDEGAAREVDSLDAADEAEAQEPLTVRLAVPDGWSLDPADAGAASITNRVIADLLYEGLTAVGDDGRAEPGLADRWIVSDDRMTWTFVLSETLTDGNGDRITARDIKSSLERVAARGSADQAATALTVITGWRDRMTGEAGGVAGIAAPDETTLVVRLDSPYELLLDVLASPAFGVTGKTDDGGLRTTGPFTPTDDPAVFASGAAESPVDRIELVSHPDGPAAAVAAGEADWAVLANGEGAGGIDAEIVRQPLELEVAIVARSPETDDRLGLLGTLEPLLLAPAVAGLTARASAAPPVADGVPAAALVDIPTGPLGALGEAVVAQLEEAGIAVLTVRSDTDAFAARVADGDAILFPIVVAGGTGPASGLLRLAAPGAGDDVFGPESAARAELAEAVATEVDLEQRALFIRALERALIDEGLLLPIGQFEVRVALGDRLDGLRHRADGTLELAGAELADSAT